MNLVENLTSNTDQSFLTNTTQFTLSSLLTRQQRLYILIYHGTMLALGAIGNALLFYCTYKNKQEPNRFGTTISALLGRDTELDFKLNRIIFLGHISFNGLMMSVVVLGPLLTTHVIGRWVLGHVLCKLIAQSTEILYISGLLVYFVMSLHRLGVIVFPDISIKPSQVQLLTMWLWVGTTFLMIFLNILSVSSTEFDQFHGTCSILNPESMSPTRYVVYTLLYGGSLLAIFTCALFLTVQSLHVKCSGSDDTLVPSSGGDDTLVPSSGSDDTLVPSDDTIVPSLLLYSVTWSALLLKMTYAHFKWDMSPGGEVVSTGAPELQVALNPLLVFWSHRELRYTLLDLFKCVACRKHSSNGDVAMEL